ncbi:lipopolysaccharide biosynthesis protein [Methylocaldum szegediense]|uniref:O-antigen/teichoic acid export membrane protein n=1 Tax=Methylocaldum szegediense TaxID=73780 RepID=A0ABM9I1P0_9GAMM|nr:oligosaccharide flippase family protein [Methylocaldum szegediense]CAI8832379.1 O-antigen/teichoic acid export membrane protein [Methylocaldum szegediense]
MATLNRILAWRPGGYARDGARIFGWLLLRAAAQALTVLLLARWLGASGYGEFVAALAVASFFTPLAGLGLGAVLLMRGARAPEHLPALSAQATRLWAISALGFTLVAAAALYWALPTPPPLWALAALALAEVAAASWVELVARRMQARHQANRFGAIQAGLPLARLVALAIGMALLPASPASWMLAYAAASFASAALIAAHVLRDPAPAPGSDPNLPWATLVRDGAPFTVGAVALRLQAEFNKPVLAHLDYAQAGALGVAQRVVDLGLLPLTALQEALWPRVYAADRPAARLWRTGAVLMALALLAGLALAAAAPLLPWLLGAEFADAASALVSLAGLPALQLMRNLGNAALIASGNSQHLNGVYLVAAAAGVLLALWLVPTQGLPGAVWAIYGSEGAALMIQGAIGAGSWFFCHHDRAARKT